MNADPVVLYTSRDCHLCEEARQVLRLLRVAFTEIDASEDLDRFLRTPVLEVAGVEVCEGEIDPVVVRRTLW